ncbi:MAG: TIM44-like domain-containing protein [Hyphomicrobiales bacterium]|nr:TIM44-like domain-containing protein [Hyphomicrobiales bacterium]
MSRFFLAGLGLLVSVFLFTTLVNTPADARAGSGFSSGSRGSFTFSRPPSTSTAPKPAAPIERSYTQPTAPSYAPSYAPAGGFGGGLFSGFGGGLMGGLLGAGLFGMMFGNGFFGGMGGGMSFFGLLLQFGLIYFAVKFLFGLFARRVAPMGAGFGPIPQPSSNGFGGGSGFQSSAPSVRPVTIDQADYAAFEEKLHAVQDAYSREDIDALRNVATPEMVAYFAEDLARNAGQGLVNRVSDVRLLQGDLAEAWGEGATEYATVAMKFSLIDTMIERASGRVVSGGQPEQVTELWTFRRDGPGAWMLSAIQQTR